MAGTTTVERVSVADLIADGGIRAVYQPIVDLDSGETVAYEALARGPAGSPLEMPGDLFPAAARDGLLSELDREARRTAVHGALSSGFPPRASLFVNVEPSSLEGTGPLLDEEGELQRRDLRVIVEFTERELAARPAAVLRAVEWLRDRGFGIALDDIGADVRSLALLPFIAPDVMKLDMALVQEEQTSRATAHVINAVGAEAERSGALILAEGIETHRHAIRARAFGAKLGQGWHFGRPGELSGAGSERCSQRVKLRPAASAARAGTPFSVLSDEIEPRRGDKRLLLALSRQLEAEAEGLGEESVLIATFQEASFFTPLTKDRYECLAAGSALVGALGVGMPELPAAGVRGGALAEDDPLRGEWDVVVIGPHFAGAFTARDLGSTGPDMLREFDFCMSYDRELVLEVARILLARIVPSAI